jgi:hypothetical protein
MKNDVTGVIQIKFSSAIFQVKHIRKGRKIKRHINGDLILIFPCPKLKMQITLDSWYVDRRFTYCIVLASSIKC